MNIDKILQTDGLDAARNETAKIAQAAKAGRAGESAAQSGADAADTSAFGHLVAKATDGIDSDLAVRQEKVDAMRDFVKNDADISDSQIDTIINRLLAN